MENYNEGLFKKLFQPKKIDTEKIKADLTNMLNNANTVKQIDFLVAELSMGGSNMELKKQLLRGFEDDKEYIKEINDYINWINKFKKEAKAKQRKIHQEANKKESMNLLEQHSIFFS